MKQIRVCFNLEAAAPSVKQQTTTKPMEQDLDQFIQDAAAFIRWCQDNDQEHLIGPTLAHDIEGLADDGCFDTLVSGYTSFT